MGVWEEVASDLAWIDMLGDISKIIQPVMAAQCFRYRVGFSLSYIVKGRDTGNTLKITAHSIMLLFPLKKLLSYPFDTGVSLMLSFTLLLNHRIGPQLIIHEFG